MVSQAHGIMVYKPLYAVFFWSSSALYAKYDFGETAMNRPLLIVNSS